MFHSLPVQADTMSASHPKLPADCAPPPHNLESPEITGEKPVSAFHNASDTTLSPERTVHDGELDPTVCSHGSSKNPELSAIPHARHHMSG